MEIRSGTAKSGELDIYYEDMGDRDDPAVVLIMGMGAQLTLWRNAFCEKLVDLGHRVIRYDHRDVGLSTKLQDQRVCQPLVSRLVCSFLGLPSQAVYKLEDMADDVAALLDHLGIDDAHVVGASMGGMVAQVVAGRHASRTKTLGVIFSSNNQCALPPPGVNQLLSLIKMPPPDAPREVAIENAVRLFKLNGSPAYPTPVENIRAEVAEAYDRCNYPAGMQRHLGAVLGSGSLLHHNRRTTAPTVVIHGTADKMMRPTGAQAITRAIRGARLVLIDGLGHELPEQVWDRVIGELKDNFAAAV